ncbi:LysR family transcriptional regulator [Ramlibacter sp.]|uniref:LysR family transcriptional regulator n=1 Tax=Ramlibacter sp. TaxID=1917967 RepID=UPI002FC638C4
MRTLPSVRQLRAFVAVYRTGQVSAAAAQLALTQPAVTVLLRELEAKLGVRLFDRSTRTLRRTEAAAEAIAYAERALAELEALGTSMAELAGVRRGRVRIAATATVAQTLLPPVLRRFLDEHPGVKVEVEDVAPTGFVETLLAERVDFGIGTLEQPVPGLREQVFLRDNLAAVSLAGPRFPSGKPITWRQLAALPLVTVKPGYGVRRRIEAAADAAGVRLQVAHEVSLLTTALAMAASGLGVAVVPASLLAYVADARLVARRLTRPAVERNTAVVSKQERALMPPAQAFVDLLLAGPAHP